ncbi:MAG: hypothetical protein ACKVTZ_10400 [Bacteroidia bacterium]
MKYFISKKFSLPTLTLSAFSPYFFLSGFQVRRLVIFFYFLISPNVCAADVPPRWAFVCGLLAAGWREHGVEQSLLQLLASI